MDFCLGWITRYGRQAPAAGLYLLFRWIGFRHFRKLERKIPLHGSVLDLGCGYGLLSNLVAAGSAARDVTGIDLLESRLKVARQVALAEKIKNVQFERRDFSDLPEGRFSAIVVADALFYYSLEKQRAILDACRQRLADGGVILIKEQGIEPGWKARMVGLQERLVVTSKTRLGRSEEWGRIAPDGVHLWNVDRLADFLRSRGLAVQHEALDAWSYLSHYLVVAWDARQGPP